MPFASFEVAWQRGSGFVVALGDWASGASALGLASALALARAPSAGPSSSDANPPKPARALEALPELPAAAAACVFLAWA